MQSSIPGRHSIVAAITAILTAQGALIRRPNKSEVAHGQSPSAGRGRSGTWHFEKSHGQKQQFDHLIGDGDRFWEVPTSIVAAGQNDRQAILGSAIHHEPAVD